MTHVRQIPDAIRERAEIHRKYREEIPALEGKDIRICMDEWNYWYGPHIYGQLCTNCECYRCHQNQYHSFCYGSNRASPEKIIITEPESYKYDGKLEVGAAEARIYRITL